MIEKVLVIAPHADDETLGCGGTLLRHKKNGDEIHFLLAADALQNESISGVSYEERNIQIKKIIDFYKFNSVHRLGFTSCLLDSYPINDIITKISNVISKTQPSIIYFPYSEDIHTDHNIIFKAVASCTKWFRYPSIHSILVYETLSETNFSLNVTGISFKPNFYVNISDFMNDKIKALEIYKSELMEHPFPRSIKAVKALSLLRGSECGYEAAESFMILKKIKK